MTGSYGLFDPNDFTGEEDTNWLVDGLIPIGGFCLVIAQSGTGKSWFLEGLAVDVACGEKFLGRDTVGGDVLLIDEDTIPAKDARKRLRKFLSGRKLKYNLFTLLGEGYRIAGGNTKSLTSVIRRPEYSNVRLIILDSLAGIVGGKSNLSTTKDASAIVDFAQSMCSDNRAFIIAHHISKNVDMSVDAMMTCDNPDKLVMENTRFQAGCQAMYFMASPTRGYALVDLFVRPWSKRVLLEKPFSIQLCDNDDTARFTPILPYVDCSSDRLARNEKRILSEFTAGAEYTVDALSDCIKGLMHPTTLRTNLTKLEEADYVVLTASRGKGGEHFYQLTEKGEGYVKANYVAKGSVSIRPSDFKGRELKKKVTV